MLDNVGLRYQMCIRDRPEDGTYPVLTVFDKSNSLTVGDTIQLEDAKLTVVGVLNDSPFSSTDFPIVICTEETFHQLTGQNLSLIHI